MNYFPATLGHIRLRTYLAAGYVLFIMYASLSPFSGWQDQGLGFYEVLSTPLFARYTWFDIVANLLAYLPFGLLMGLALGTRFGALGSVLLAMFLGASLSATMEYAQMYLPTRYSSNLDLLTNTSGALLGAIAAVSIAPRPWFHHYLAHRRLHLFQTGSERDLGLSLAALWVFAQINPSLPMLGNVFISKVARIPFAAVKPPPFRWLESAAVTFNLLMLGMLLLTLLRQRRHTVNALMMVLCVVALAKFVTAALLLKSWALLLWINSEAMFGIFSGMLLLAAVTRLQRPQLIGCAALVTVTYLILANWILDSGRPSAAMRLYQWNYGHLLTYNGLSQTITLVFPFVMLVYLWRIRSKVMTSVM